MVQLPPEPGRRPSGTNGGRGAIVLRVVAGLFTAAAGAVFLLTAWMAISSRLGWNDRDVHGYGLIFGTILAILAAFIVALVLPLALAHQHRRRAYSTSMPAFGVVFILLIAALVTA